MDGQVGPGFLDGVDIVVCRDGLGILGGADIRDLGYQGILALGLVGGVVILGSQDGLALVGGLVLAFLAIQVRG